MPLMEFEDIEELKMMLLYLITQKISSDHIFCICNTEFKFF